MPVIKSFQGGRITPNNSTPPTRITTPATSTTTTSRGPTSSSVGTSTTTSRRPTATSKRTSTTTLRVPTSTPTRTSLTTPTRPTMTTTTPPRTTMPTTTAKCHPRPMIRILQCQWTISSIILIFYFWFPDKIELVDILSTASLMTSMLMSMAR